MGLDSDKFLIGPSESEGTKVRAALNGAMKVIEELVRWNNEVADVPFTNPCWKNAELYLKHNKSRF